MNKNLINNEFTYLGCAKLRISEYENKLCYFYNLILARNSVDEEFHVKRINSWLYGQHNGVNDTVGNNDYFIIKRQDSEVLVTIDEALKVDGKKVISSKNIKVNDNTINDFFYCLTYYYIQNEDYENAVIAIANTGDMDVFVRINNVQTIEDKKEISHLLKENINKEIKNKVYIKTKQIEDDRVSLLQLLELIQGDTESKLLWDYRSNYEKIGTNTVMIEDNIRFIKPSYGYGEVSRITIGDKKINIGVKVKIEGYAINIEDGLKLDSHVYREYNIVLDGKLNTRYINCKLSKELKKKIKAMKIISDIKDVFGEEIITLDISKLNIINKRIIKPIDQEDLAQGLYAIEELTIRLNILKKILKSSVNKDIELLSKKEKTKVKYRVDIKGLYHPIAVDMIKDNNMSSIYVGRIVEWRVDRFPRKIISDKWSEYYEKLSKTTSDKIIGEYEIVKKSLLDLKYKINLIRLYSVLNNKSIFIWDNEIVKEKKENDIKLGINLIIGEKMNISTKSIGNITIRQNLYSVIEKY